MVTLLRTKVQSKMMKKVNTKEKLVAPGELEHVRVFLNTWRIPNDTRLTTDLFDSQEGVQQFQETHFPDVECTDEVELLGP